jgi:hypothetical protein
MSFINLTALHHCVLCLCLSFHTRWLLCYGVKKPSVWYNVTERVPKCAPQLSFVLSRFVTSADFLRGRGSSVGIVTKLWARWPGFDSQETQSRPALGPTQPRIQRVPVALSPRLKWPEREADHSPPSSADIKNAWSYTSTPPHVFTAWCVMKHRGNFTFTDTFNI